MPRQPRFRVPGIPQHVVQRGVDRRPTFFSQLDYSEYLRCLKSASRRYPCHIHAYVLMTNHVHLLVTPQIDDAIAKIAQAIGREYVQPLNIRYGRTGTLWEARYKASIVQSDFYFLACHRYIELNPVRAGMVESPEKYPYSSYACNALGRCDSLITPHPAYLALGNEDSTRRATYRYLFTTKLQDKLVDQIRTETNACRAIGSDRFKDYIESIAGRPARPGRVGRPPARQHQTRAR